MPARKLKEFLDERGVKYITISHSPAYTSQEIAASAHIPGQQLAKTVIVRLNGELAMAVLPASKKVDLGELAEATGARQAELASEAEFRHLFPDCELGAMPPFGNLYDLPVHVAWELAEDNWIAFNAGSHTELLRLRYEDFQRLVQPNVFRFAVTSA